MKVVILGAGASFDSLSRLYDEPGNNKFQSWRPPLGNDIFGNRPEFREIYTKYPGAYSLSNDINSVKDIEVFFQQKYDFIEKTGDRIMLANLISCQYYFSELFYTISHNFRNNIGACNYSKLIKKAYEYAISEKEEVAFVTFNYDLLLEYAFMDFCGISIQDYDMNFYLKHPIKIFKPHGSCNWFRKLPSDCTILDVNPSSYFWQKKHDHEWIKSNVTSEIFVDNNAFSQAYNRALPPFYGQSSYYFPQLLVPLKRKDEFIMPDSHKKKMIECLEKSSEILVIGWKGQEESFIQLLKDCISNRSVNSTIISLNDESVLQIMNKTIPNGNHNLFTENYYEGRPSKSGGFEITLEHQPGSFSSYMLNWLKGNEFNNSYFFDKV